MIFQRKFSIFCPCRHPQNITQSTDPNQLLGIILSLSITGLPIHWSTTSVVNHDLVNDPTVRVPGFSLPHSAQWCTLNRLKTGQGRCASCLKNCPVNKLDGGILRLHSADETAVQWLNTHLAWRIQQHQRGTGLSPFTVSLETANQNQLTPKQKCIQLRIKFRGSYRH